MSEHDVIYLKDRQNSPRTTCTPAAQPDLALSESNHRISNHLALLASSVSLRAAALAKQGLGLESDEVAAILRTCEFNSWPVDRLLAMRPDSDPIDLDEFLHSLCETLVSALALPGQVELITLATVAVRSNSTHALPLSLIVTEVVTNSLKYAHPAHAPGKLVVGCRREATPGFKSKSTTTGLACPRISILRRMAGLVRERSGRWRARSAQRPGTRTWDSVRSSACECRRRRQAATRRMAAFPASGACRR